MRKLLLAGLVALSSVILIGCHSEGPPPDKGVGAVGTGPTEPDDKDAKHPGKGTAPMASTTG